MELRLEWDEFVRLSRGIKRDLTPEWEPVLMAPTFELAVDPDYEIAYRHDRLSGRVEMVAPDYAAQMVGMTTFGQLFLGPMRAHAMDVETLNRVYPAWMRVALEGWG